MTDNGWNQIGVLADEAEVALMSHQHAEPIKTWSTSKGKITSVVIYDYDDTLKEGQLLPDLPPKCPHCQRDWHPGPLTNDVVAMLENHHFRADYNPDADESEIRCVGANYLGPNRHGGPVGYIYDSNVLGIQPGAAWVWPQIEFDTSPLAKAQAAISNIFDAMSALLLGAGPPITFSTWLGNLTPKPVECDPPTGDIDPELGPAWPVEIIDAMPIEMKQAAKIVGQYDWQTHTYTFPVPKLPGYDFSEYASETMDYTTIGKGKK